MEKRAIHRAAFPDVPMDMMIHALQAEALDAIIAPSPWGIHAESTGLGRRDPRFSPGKFAQRLVMVSIAQFLEQHPDLSQTLARNIAGARTQLKDPATFTKSIERMSRCGRPLVQRDILEKAATVHSFSSLDNDEIPDMQKLVAELMALNIFRPSEPGRCQRTDRAFCATRLALFGVATDRFGQQVQENLRHPCQRPTRFPPGTTGPPKSQSGQFQTNETTFPDRRARRPFR